MLTQHLFYIGEDSDVTSNDNRNDEHVNAMVDVNFQNRFSSLPRLKKPRHVFYNDMSEENNNIKRGRRTYGGRDVRTYSYDYNDNNDKNEKNENKTLENNQRLKVDPSCLFFGTDTKKTDLAESFTNVHKSIGLDTSSKYSITTSISGNDSITSSLSAIDTTKTDLKVKHSTSDSQKYVGLQSSEDNLPIGLNTARGDDLDREKLVLETESIPLQTKNIVNVNQNSQSQLNVVKSHAEYFGNVMIQNEDTMNVNSTFSINNLLTVDSHPVKMAGGTDIIENNTCSDMPSADQSKNDNNINSVNFNGINDVSQVTSCGNKHKSIHTKDRITTKQIEENKMEGDTSLLTMSKGNMSFYCPSKQINSTSLYDKNDNSDDAKKVCMKPAHDKSEIDILSGQEISTTHDDLVGCNVLSGNLFVEKSRSNGCTVNCTSLYDKKNDNSDDAKKVCLKPAHDETLCGGDIGEGKNVKGVTDHGLVESDILSGQEISAPHDNLKETLKGTIEKSLNARLKDGNISKENNCGEFFTDDILAGNLFVENSGSNGDNLNFVEKTVNQGLAGDLLGESDSSTGQEISEAHVNLVKCDTLNRNNENDLNAGLISNENNFDNSFINDISSDNLFVEKSVSIGFTGDNLKFGLVDPCVDNNNNISNRPQVDNVPASVLSTEHNFENTKSDANCSLNSVIFAQSDISTRHYTNNHESVKNDKLFNDDANSVLKNDRNAINEVFNNLTSGSYGFLSKANELIEKLELPAQGGSTEVLLDENSNIVSDDPGLSLNASQNIRELIKTENELESTLDGNLQNGILQNDIGVKSITLNASQNITELTKKENEIDSSLEDNLQDSNLQNVNLQNNNTLPTNIPNIETDKQEIEKIQNDDISTLQKEIPNISQTDVNLDIYPDTDKQRADISQNGHVESSTIIECKTGKQKYHIELEKTKSIKGEGELKIAENNSSGDEKDHLLSKPCDTQNTELLNNKGIIVQVDDLISEQDELSIVNINDTCKEQTDLFYESDLSKPCFVPSQFEEKGIIIVQDKDLINKKDEIPIINTTCIEEANLFQEKDTSKPCPVQDYKSDKKDIQTEHKSEEENTQKDTSSQKKLAINSNLEINNLNPNFETDCLQTFISTTINNQVNNINNRVNTDTVPCNDNNVSLYTSNLLNAKNNKLQNTTSNALNSQLNLDSEACQTVSNSRQEFNKYIERDIPGTLVDSFNTTSDRTCDTKNDEDENENDGGLNEDVKSNGDLFVDENKFIEKDIPGTLFDRFDTTCCNTKNDKDENEEEVENFVGVSENERTSSNFLIDENEREGCTAEMAEVEITKNETIEVLAVHFQAKTEDDNLTDTTSESENYFNETKKEMTEVTCNETNSINKELETDIILKIEKEQLKNHLQKEETYNDASKEKENDDTINTNIEIKNNSKNTLKKLEEEEKQDLSIQLNGSLDTGKEIEKQDPSIQSNGNLDTGLTLGNLNEEEEEEEKHDPSIQSNGNLDTGSIFGKLNGGEDQLFGKTVSDCKINIHDETSNQEIDVINCELELTNNEIISCSAVGKVDHMNLNVGCKQESIVNGKAVIKINETVEEQSKDECKVDLKPKNKSNEELGDVKSINGIENDSGLNISCKEENISSGNHKTDINIDAGSINAGSKDEVKIRNEDLSLKMQSDQESRHDNLSTKSNDIDDKIVDDAVDRHANMDKDIFNGLKNGNPLNGGDTLSPCVQNGRDNDINGMKPIEEPCSTELIPNQEQEPDAVEMNDVKPIEEPCTFEPVPNQEQTPNAEADASGSDSESLGSEFDIQDHIDKSKTKRSERESRIRSAFSFVLGLLSDSDDDVDVPVHDKLNKYTRHATPDGKKRNGSFKEDLLRGSVKFLSSDSSVDEDDVIIPLNGRTSKDDVAIPVNGKPSKDDVNSIIPVNRRQSLGKNGSIFPEKGRLLQDKFDLAISVNGPPIKNEAVVPVLEDCQFPQDENLLQSMDEIIAFSSPISSPFVLEKNESNFNLTDDSINLQLEDSTSSTITDNNVIIEEDRESTIVSDREGTVRNNTEMPPDEITLTENVQMELKNGTLLDEVDLGAKEKPFSTNIENELDTIGTNSIIDLLPTDNVLTDKQIAISSTLDLSPLEDNCMNNEEPMQINIEPNGQPVNNNVSVLEPNLVSKSSSNDESVQEGNLRVDTKNKLLPENDIPDITLSSVLKVEPLLIDIEPKNELLPINTVNAPSVPNEEPLLVPVTISTKETREKDLVIEEQNIKQEPENKVSSTANLNIDTVLNEEPVLVPATISPGKTSGQGLINEEQNVKKDLNEEPSDILVLSIDTRNIDSVLNEELVIVPVRCNIERDLEIIGNEHNEKSEIEPNEEELFDKTDITVLEPDYDYDYYEPSSTDELDSSAQMKELNISFQKKIDSNVDIVDNDKVIIEIISLLIDQVDEIFKSVNNEKVASRNSSFTEKEDALSNEEDLSYPQIGFDIHDNNVNGSISDDEKVPIKTDTFPLTYADICKGQSKMDIGAKKDANEKRNYDCKKGISKEHSITNNYKEQLTEKDSDKALNLGEDFHENTCNNTIDANINELKNTNTQECGEKEPVQENIIEPLISLEVKSDNPTNFEKLISLQKDDIVSKCITNTTDLIIVDNNNDVADILNVSPIINVDVKPQVPTTTTNNTKRRKSKGDIGKIHPQCASDYQLIAFGHDDTRVENNLSLFIKEKDFLTDDEVMTFDENIIMSTNNNDIKNINGDSEIENEEKLDDRKDEKVKKIHVKNEASTDDKRLDGIITTNPADIIEVINHTLNEVSIADAKINDVSEIKCENEISIKEEEEPTTNDHLNENSHHTGINIEGSNTQKMTSTDINSSCLLKGDVFNPNNSETEQKMGVCNDDNMTECTRNVGDIEQENITCDDVPIKDCETSNNEECVNLNVSHTLSSDLLENVANLDIKHILTSNSLENTQDNGGINQNSVVITNLNSNSCEKNSNVENTTCVDIPTIDFDNIPVISAEQTKNLRHVDLGYTTALISDLPLSVQGNYDNCDVVTNLDVSNVCNSNEEDSHSIIVKEEVFTIEDENKVEMEIQMEDLFEENYETQVIDQNADLSHTKGKVLDSDQSSDKAITIENKDKIEIETTVSSSQVASEIGKNIVIRRKSDQLISFDETDGYCDISIKDTKNDSPNHVNNSEITNTFDILVPEIKPNEFPEKSTDSVKNIKSFDSFDILDDFASSPTLEQRNSSLVENDNTASDIDNDSFELYGYSSEILDIATSLIDDSNLLIVEESFTSIDNKTKNTLDSINDVSNLLDDSTLLIDDSADLLDDASALMDGTKSLISDSTASVDDLLASISQMKPSRDFTNNNPDLTVINEKNMIHTDVVLNNDQTNPSLISDITTLINNTSTLLSDFHSLSDDFVQPGVIESNTDINNVLDKQESVVTILENASSQRDELLKDNLNNDENENILNVKDKNECLTKKESSIDENSKDDKLLENEIVCINEKQVSPYVELENPLDTLQTSNSEEIFTTPCEELENPLDITTNSSLNDDQPNTEIDLPKKELVHPNMEIELPNKDFVNPNMELVLPNKELLHPNMEPETPFEIVENPYKEFETPNKDFHISYKLTTPNPSITDSSTSISDTLTSILDTTKLDSDSSTDSEEEKEGYQTVLDRFNALIGSRK